jgi:hypothetical protein
VEGCSTLSQQRGLCGEHGNTCHEEEGVEEIRSEG